MKYRIVYKNIRYFPHSSKTFWYIVEKRFLGLFWLRVWEIPPTTIREMTEIALTSYVEEQNRILKESKVITYYV